MSTPSIPPYARPQAPPNNLGVALAYLAKHPTRYLFPCIGGKARPAFKNNLKLASNDPEQLKKWQKEYESRGRIMWACSPHDHGIFCLDPDLQKLGAKERGKQYRVACDCASRRMVNVGERVGVDCSSLIWSRLGARARAQRQRSEREARRGYGGYTSTRLQPTSTETSTNNINDLVPNGGSRLKSPCL